MSRHHDLVIIGTGSGNSILDERFDTWDVAIVERGVFGGTCLNVGCIPTKMLVHPADIVDSVRHAGSLGVDAHVDRIRWTDIRDRVFDRIDPIAAGGEQYRRSLPNVTVYGGDGRFVGDKTLEITDARGRVETVTADRFVLAAGARPVVPDAVVASGVPFHTSDTIMRIDEVPERLIIVGGGFIASELAHVFASFGATVSIVARSATMLRHHDHDIAERYTVAAARTYDLHLSSTVDGVAANHDQVMVAVTGADGLTRKLEADMLLVATGREPNGAQLNVVATGVELDDLGFVRTDATLETSVPGIYALGDIRTPLMLKHVANHEARVVQHNLLHPTRPKRISEDVVPHAVFGSPQVAAVGLDEADARATGARVGVSLRSYGDTAAGWAYEDTTSICKVIADLDSRLILGAHLIGPHAAILVQQFVQAMAFGLTVDQVARGQMYVHPAFSEVVEQALLEL